MKRITIITELHDLTVNKSSTNIMTNNLINGFKQNNVEVYLIGIVDNRYDPITVENYYKDLVNDVHIVKSRLNLIGIRNKYKQLYKITRATLNPNNFGIDLKDGFFDGKVLAMIPSLEAAFIANVLKKRNPNIEYIQYWSDPYTMSGISREAFNYKRFIQFFIEKSILQYADKVIYFTEPLMKQQKAIFTKYSGKMKYVDGSYIEGIDILNNNKLSTKMNFGYAGSYNPYIRDIIPLYNSFIDFQKAELTIIGNRDVEMFSSKNIHIYDFISQDKISDYEKEFDVIVCLTNHSTIQMPGKVFYSVNTDKVILIILDGAHADEIRKYLEKFKRFEFCYNNKSSIKDAIDRLVKGEYKVDMSQVDKLSPKNIALEIYNEFFLKSDRKCRCDENGL